MDPDQTAPKAAVRFGSTLFIEEASKTIQQATKADNLVVYCINALAYVFVCALTSFPQGAMC